MKIEDVFHRTVKEYGMLQKGDGVVVGVSGGPDSIALLHLLYRFKEHYGIELVAAHLNHNFRPGEAEKEAEYVKEFCVQRDIPCIVEFCDVPRMAEEEGLSMEQAGRKARYSFFNRVMDQKGFNKIATGHNLNDQVETVLMKFIRGAGMEGLAGIHPVRGNIIRPFLEVPRLLIERYCEEHRLNPAIDKSNLSPIYHRNKVRLQLLPLLREQYNKNIENVIISTAQILRDENDYLNRAALEELEGAVISYERDELVLDLEVLRRLHIAILRRVLRQAVRKLKGNTLNIEYSHIKALCSVIHTGAPGSQVQMPEGMTASLSYNRLIITTRRFENKAINNIYRIEVPGITYVDETRGLVEAKVLTKEEYLQEREIYKDNRLIAYFDLSKTGEDLIIRGRKDGDRFRPLGMKGTKKLKDFFIDLKIPRHQRDSIPIIEGKGAIIWVAGYRIGEDFKVDENTDRVLKLHYKLSNEEE